MVRLPPLGAVRVGGRAERPDGDLPAAQALPDVIVRLSFQVELQPGNGEGAETLAGAPTQPQADRRGEAGGAQPPDDVARDPGPEGEVVVADRIAPGERPSQLERAVQLGEDLVVERRGN